MGIPLEHVRIINGPDDVLSFPATAEITELAFRPGSLHLRYTKQGIWPPVPFGDAAQEATVWILAHINGEWVAAGMERLRPNQIDKPEGNDPAGFVAGFVEGRDFGPFNGHVFQPGEHVGVMVVAGNSRLGADFTVRERTRVVEAIYPPDGTILWTEGQSAPPPPPPDAPPVPSDELAAALARLQRIEDNVGTLIGALPVLLEALANLDAQQVELSTSLAKLKQARTGTVRLPVLGSGPVSLVAIP